MNSLRSPYLFALVSAALLSAGCPKSTCARGNCSDGGDDGSVTYGSLGIVGAAQGMGTPSATVPLIVYGPTSGMPPAFVQFSASYSGSDVTGQTQWSVGDVNMGTIDRAGLFTAASPCPHGGPVSIFGSKGNLTGGATVLIECHPDPIIAGGASNQAPMQFAGGPTGDATEIPQILYPLDGTMLASNIYQINFQWTGSPKDSLYRIQIVGSGANSGQTVVSSSYVGISACRQDQKSSSMLCQYQPKDADWRTIAASSIGGTAVVTISGTAGGSNPVADSLSMNLNFSPEPINGGFYYFSPTINGVKRVPFGSSVATNFITNGSGFKCAGCHAISRDGTRVAATFNGGDGTGGIVDGAQGMKFFVKPVAGGGYGVNRWNFATFSPDGSMLLTNWAGVLTLRDGTTGNKMRDISTTITGGQAVMPEWSPDQNGSSSVVFVQVPAEGKLGKDFPGSGLVAGDWDTGNTGTIAVMQFSNGEFQTATPIVPAVPQSEYHYFPTWSPDSQWIVFATGKYPGNSPTAAGNLFGYAAAPSPKGFMMPYDQDTARLRMVSVMGGPVIELGNATHASNRSTSWPKFAPFLQKQGSLVFITFGAKFDYGFTVTDGQTPQLWMSAIDLDRARSMQGNQDPSYPPFWLPFQNPMEKNHSGIWTQNLRCSMSADCAGADFVCCLANDGSGTGTCKQGTIEGGNPCPQ